MAEGATGAMRVAVVGCGRMGRAHVEAIRSLDEDQIDLVVCDPSQEAREWAAALRLRTFRDMDAALKDGELDAVVIAATTATHIDLAREALERGCAVLCEKPGGTDPSALSHLGDAAARTGQILRVGYWHRFVPALRLIRDAIAEGRFGEILALSSAQWDGFPPSPTFLSGSGGELVDMGVHEIDFARWSLGRELQVRGAARRSDAEGYNAAVGVLQSDDGTVVSVSTGRFLEGGLDGCWVELFGSKGSLFDRWLWGADGDMVNRLGVAHQDRAFLRLVAGHPSEDLATAADGAAVLALANALTGVAGPRDQLATQSPGRA